MGSFVEKCRNSITVHQENRKLKKWIRDHPNSRRKRSEVTVFTEGSRKRLAKRLWNNAHRFKYFATLTYQGKQTDSEKAKKHLNDLFNRFRDAFGTNFGYLWVLEFHGSGGIHFHVWMESFEVKHFDEWKSIPVRKKIRERFKRSPEDLDRFKFLAYLWLVASDGGMEKKRVLAAVDLLPITSVGFIKNYALKYALKSEQKVFKGHVDEETGEILSMKTGRFWGCPRCVRDDREFYSEDIQDVRTIRRAMKSFKGVKRFSGTWNLWDEGLEKKLRFVGDRLKLEKITGKWKER